MNKGKGAEIGATFNSSTNEIFGSKGSDSVLNTIIIILASISLIANLFINTMNKNEKEKTIEPIVKMYDYQSNLSDNIDK